MSTRIRVLCVEDNPLVGDAIARKLIDDPDFEWLGWVSSSADLFKKVAEAPPDVICMDLDMPGECAFEMIAALRTASPNSRVMILSGHTSQRFVEAAYDAGAWGFLSKAEESRRIIQAIKHIAEGSPAFGPLLDSDKKSPPLPQSSESTQTSHGVKPLPPKARSSRLFSFFRGFR